MADKSNTEGREANEAEPLGDFTALGGKESVRKTGEESRKRAGPDGPDASYVGDTFKGPAGDPAEGKR
ncbi:hypothetical protein [Caulobacter sp.]|uniref:hypothetical protein n=1 Tax=Caulobacter sp. TaxID=78 RepID=UPI002B46E4F6|nr:hypothetical protein [Caulobacter sp.]HJV41942.1 hypothetical protein [Caulobacter sp.]